MANDHDNETINKAFVWGQISNHINLSKCSICFKKCYRPLKQRTWQELATCAIKPSKQKFVISVDTSVNVRGHPESAFQSVMLN